MWECSSILVLEATKQILKRKKKSITVQWQKAVIISGSNLKCSAKERNNNKTVTLAKWSQLLVNY